MTIPDIFEEPYTQGLLSAVIDAVLNISDVFGVVDVKAEQAQDLVDRIREQLDGIDEDSDEYRMMRGRMDAFQLLHDRAKRIVANNPHRYSASDPKETK